VSSVRRLSVRLRSPALSEPASTQERLARAAAAAAEHEARAAALQVCGEQRRFSTAANRPTISTGCMISGRLVTDALPARGGAGTQAECDAMRAAASQEETAVRAMAEMEAAMAAERAECDALRRTQVRCCAFPP
jgi:hypothetical protein